VVKLTSLFDEHLQFDDCFILEIAIVEARILYRKCPNSIQSYVIQDYYIGSTPSSAFDLGSHLLDPSGGDVVFVVLDRTFSQRKLFATKQILATNSEYFACRIIFCKIY
jgi:hypothetical protein